MDATSLMVAGTPFSGAALLGHLLGAHEEAFFAGVPEGAWPAGETRECAGCGADCAVWNEPAVTAARSEGAAVVAAALAASTGRRVVIEGPLEASGLAARLAAGRERDEDTRVVLCVCDPLRYVRKRAGVTADYARRRVAEWREQQEALVEVALGAGRPLLVVRYEDLLEREAATLARVRDFAGLGAAAPAAQWWSVPTHARGAESEAWGPAASGRPRHGSGREARVETLATQDREPAEALGLELARVVIGELAESGLYERYGYAPTLPAYRAPQDAAERERLAGWAREDLGRVREAVMAGRGGEAIGALRLLVEHFGPALDELGLELGYEAVAGLLVELLVQEGRGAEALPHARALAERSPADPQAQRLVAVAGASAGDAGTTLAAYERLVGMSGAGAADDAVLAQDVAALLAGAGMAEPGARALLEQVAGQPELAAAVDATLTARLRGGDQAEGVYAALDAVREARGLPFCPHSPPDFLETRRRLFPSIWLGRFESHAEWAARSDDAESLMSVTDAVDDRLMGSRHPHAVKAWCAVCAAPQMMNVSWRYGEVSESGSFNPSWTETFLCPTCGFNSRMRALYALVSDELQLPPTAQVYLAERVTPGYRIYKSRFPNLVGSEYLGPKREPGREYKHGGTRVRHEDATRLSFAPASFDAVITQDVFEHIPDFGQALRECRRVLKPGGRLAFSIPFFSWQAETETIARVNADGSIEHLRAPEYHGNPVGNGSLCFHHFGWDILDGLRAAGFATAAAHLYWGPWQGHGGAPLFVFSAQA